MFLSRVPQEIIVENEPGNVNPQGGTAPAQVAKDILRSFRAALRHARARNTKAQQRYKEDYDRKMKRVTVALPGYCGFLNIPLDGQRPTLAEEKDDIRIEADINSKLLVRATGPFEVIRADPQTATVVQYGSEGTILVERATKAPVTSGQVFNNSALMGDGARRVAAFCRD